MYDCSKYMSQYEAEKVALTSDDRREMRERRNSNRTRLKNGLAVASKPKPIGMYSQGSYAMWTMVQDANLDYDIDDGAYFDEAVLVGAQGAEMSALAVRQMICEALQDERFKKPPEVRPNCVRVFYDEGYHADVPAYRRRVRTTTWDGKNEYYYELAGPQWKESDPRKVTQWFDKVDTDLSPDVVSGEGQLRRVVRMLKMFARSRASWKGSTATGFMITKLVADKYFGQNGRDDWCLRETARQIVDRLALDPVIRHPVLEQNITKDGDGRPTHFMEKLSENLQHLAALDKSNCTHGEAMTAWDKFFNTDWFSQQPPPADRADKDDTSPSKPAVKGGAPTKWGVR